MATMLNYSITNFCFSISWSDTQVKIEADEPSFYDAQEPEHEDLLDNEIKGKETQPGGGEVELESVTVDSVNVKPQIIDGQIPNSSIPERPIDNVKPVTQGIYVYRE